MTYTVAYEARAMKEGHYPRGLWSLQKSAPISSLSEAYITAADYATASPTQEQLVAAAQREYSETSRLDSYHFSYAGISLTFTDKSKAIEDGIQPENIHHLQDEPPVYWTPVFWQIGRKSLAPKPEALEMVA